MRPPNSIAAIILCGGRSIRMGRDKASLLLNGEPFLTRICRIIDSVASPVIAVSSDQQQLPDIPDRVSVVFDLWKDEGPLAGLLTGLESIAEHSPDSEMVWLGSCDAPLVNTQVVTSLSQTSGTWDAVMVQSGGRLQPFGGIYRTCVRHKLQALFDAGERRLHTIANSVNVSKIEAESLRQLDPELDFLRNINTTEDYKALSRDSSGSR